MIIELQADFYYQNEPLLIIKKVLFKQIVYIISF